MKHVIVSEQKHKTVYNQKGVMSGHKALACHYISIKCFSVYECY
jgi:hypothetical protein